MTNKYVATVAITNITARKKNFTVVMNTAITTVYLRSMTTVVWISKKINEVYMNEHMKKVALRNSNKNEK